MQMNQKEQVKEEERRKNKKKKQQQEQKRTTRKKTTRLTTSTLKPPKTPFCKGYSAEGGIGLALECPLPLPTCHQEIQKKIQNFNGPCKSIEHTSNMH